jgi:hypothetical protein
VREDDWGSRRPRGRRPFGHRPARAGVARAHREPAGGAAQEVENVDVGLVRCALGRNAADQVGDVAHVVAEGNDPEPFRA